MKIKTISLKNFRNHKKAGFNFKKSNLIYGPNASGKTALLESIAFASTLRSPRTARLKELICWEKKDSFVQLCLSKKGKIQILRYVLTREGKQSTKRFSLDGRRTEAKEIIGTIRSVYFSPESLEIITGSPTQRRRFLDILLSQTDASYLSDLIEYRKVLFNRNRLIKDIAEGRSGKDEMFFWNESLVSCGSRIIKKRQKIAKELSLFFTKHYKNISGKSKTQAGIKYKPSIRKEKRKTLRSSFRDKIEKEFEWELKYKSTLIGPHRDDLNFSLDKKTAKSFCSRGEIRSLIISLKLSEANYIYEKTGDRAVVLLDDIYSELDESRALFLSGALFTKNQVIATTADKNIVKKLTKKHNVNIVNIKKE